MVYFLIGTKILENSEEDTWQKIKSQVFTATLGNNAEGKIITQDKDLNKFKFGNLDSLMFMNDQIIKMEVRV